MQPGLVEKVTCKRVPLNSIDVDTVIYGTFASVTSKFLYENVSDVAIETVFQFPMDDGAECSSLRQRLMIDILLQNAKKLIKPRAPTTVQFRMGMGLSWPRNMSLVLISLP